MGKKNKKKNKTKTDNSQIHINKKLYFNEKAAQSNSEEFLSNDSSHFNTNKKKLDSNRVFYSAEVLLAKTEECIDSFNFDLALKFCERALEVAPNDCHALETAAVLYLEVDQNEKAKNFFKRAVDLQPGVGHSKYMYLGQLSTGAEAVSYFLSGIKILEEQISLPSNFAGEARADLCRAYCSLAEIYLTDECLNEEAESNCQSILEKALNCDPKNSEALQLMASFFISKGELEKAKLEIEKSISMWLPSLKEFQDTEGQECTNETDPLDQNCVQSCQLSYPTRLNAAKILIEVQSYERAADVLESLLGEEDEIVEVWYLLGWTNYLQGQEYKSNARFYLNKSLEVSKKTQIKDNNILEHINQLLSELGEETESELIPSENENIEESDNDMDIS